MTRLCLGEQKSNRTERTPLPAFPARTGQDMSSPTLLAYTVIVLLLAYRLADTYLGGGYVCPSCGARSADRHAGDCPWSR